MEKSGPGSDHPADYNHWGVPGPHGLPGVWQGYLGSSHQFFFFCFRLQLGHDAPQLRVTRYAE